MRCYEWDAYAMISRILKGSDLFNQKKYTLIALISSNYYKEYPLGLQLNNTKLKAKKKLGLPGAHPLWCNVGVYAPFFMK